MMSTSADVPDSVSAPPKALAAKTASVTESADSSSDSASESDSSSESNPNGSQSSGTGSSSGVDQPDVVATSDQEFATPRAPLNPVSIDFDQIRELPEATACAPKAAEGLHPPSVASLSDPPALALPSSPIVTTPGKSLLFQVSTLSTAKRTAAALESTPAVAKTIPNPAPAISTSTEVGSDTAPVINPVSKELLASNQASSTSTSKATGALKVVPTSEIDIKTVKKVDKNSIEHKLASDQRKAERYQKKVAKLEKLIQKTDQDKAAKSSRAAKDKKRRRVKKSNKKAKKAALAEASSEGLASEESASSSDSSVPGPSNRIGKLSHGRKLQQLSMARVKELGRLRNTDLNALQVSEALKVIDSIELDINPDQAYLLFHRVPGSGLPHMDKFYRDFSHRYNILVKAIVKFHLLQAQKLNSARNESLGPELENPLFPWWQFLNDLSRAPSVTTHLEAPTLEDIDQPPVAKKTQDQRPYCR